MTRKYENFPTTEMADGTYVVAEPRNQTDDPVRLEAGWFDGDNDVEGEWEDTVGAIIQSDITGEMQLKEGTGTIPRHEAVENLVEAEQDGEPLVTGEAEAEALLDYFEHNDVLDFDGDDVVLLKDPNEVSGKMVLNWAAAMTACVDKIDETMERFRQARQKLEEHMENVEADPQQAEDMMKEKAQELMALGDGQGFPDRASLSPEDQEKYDVLKEDFVYYKKLNEAGQTNVSTAQQGVDQIATMINKLKSARQVLDQKQGQIRARALNDQVFPQSEVDIAMNMGELVTSLAGVGGIQDEVEDMSEDDTEAAVKDVLSDTEALDESLDQALGDDMEETDQAQTTEFSQ